MFDVVVAVAGGKGCQVPNESEWGRELSAGSVRRSATIAEEEEEEEHTADDACAATWARLLGVARAVHMVERGAENELNGIQWKNTKIHESK